MHITKMTYPSVRQAVPLPCTAHVRRKLQCPPPLGDALIKTPGSQRRLRTTANALMVPQASVVTLEPLVTSAAAALTAAIAVGLIAFNNRRGHGEKAQIAKIEQGDSWFDLVKLAGPIVAFLIFSLNANQQLGALGAQQIALKESIDMLRQDVKANGVKLDALSQNAAYQKGIEAGQKIARTDSTP